MLIAVMSDSHDNIWNLEKAIDIIRKDNADMIIHCGDFVAPFMLKALDQAKIPVHGVFGNNDGDQYQLTKLSLSTLHHITLHGLVGNIHVKGFNVAFTHQGDVGQGLASTDAYELVCFGHTHQYFSKTIGRTILLNPGEIMGKEGSPGFCFVDTETSDIWQVRL